MFSQLIEAVGDDAINRILLELWRNHYDPKLPATSLDREFGDDASLRAAVEDLLLAAEPLRRQDRRFRRFSLRGPTTTPQ